MVRYLAESENYKVTAEYEMVFLHFKNKPNQKPIYIGDFYGDPTCAIISCDEQYVVMAGCGIIIYRLTEPFCTYGIGKSSEQYSEFHNRPRNIWWTDGLYQTLYDEDWKYFRFVAANEEGTFIYRMDSTTFAIDKIGAFFHTS
jgi:hypothetical protein